MSRKDRLDDIKGRINDAVTRSGRHADDVTLIAVSKTFSVEDILEVASLGQVDFGENKVQELRAKTEALGSGTPERPIRWHHIGHLQRNKAKDIVGRCDLFHALDSERLAMALQNRLEAAGADLKCLIQVNVSGETSKFGVAPAELGALLDAVSTLDRISVVGLMTLASPASNPESIRPEFALMRELSVQHSSYFKSDSPMLSMGMSGDFEVAIEEGATHVRVGSALFGSRQYPAQ